MRVANNQSSGKPKKSRLILKARYMEIPPLHHDTEVVFVAWNDRLSDKLWKYYADKLSGVKKRELKDLLQFGITFYPVPCTEVVFVEKKSKKMWQGLVRRISGKVFSTGGSRPTGCNNLAFLVNSLHQISKKEL